MRLEGGHEGSGRNQIRDTHDVFDKGGMGRLDCPSDESGSWLERFGCNRKEKDHA